MDEIKKMIRQAMRFCSGKAFNIFGSRFFAVISIVGILFGFFILPVPGFPEIGNVVALPLTFMAVSVIMHTKRGGYRKVKDDKGERLVEVPVDISNKPKFK